MKYNVPYGFSDEATWGDTPYINGDPSIGRAGSIPPAASIEYTQREVVNALRLALKGDGSAFITPSNSDLTQLSKTIQSLLFNYQRDAGTVNVCQVTLSPAPTAYFEGLTVFMKVANANTGIATLNVNALGAKTITKTDGTSLIGGELLVGMQAMLRYDGTNFQVITSIGGQAQRLLANKDLYVSASIGNDSNDGISNTVGHALLTIQRAVDIAFNYLPSQFNITIHVSAGTYTAGGRTPLYAGPTLIIDGAGIASTFVNPTNDYAFLVQGPNVMTVTNVMSTPIVASLGPSPFASTSGATLRTNFTKSGACLTSIFLASQNANVYPINHTFAGNSAYGYQATYGGNVQVLNATITISAAITMSGSFVNASALGIIVFPASTPTSFVNPGNVTGTRFLCGANGVINADGQGVNFFPGTVAGTASTGGQYT